MNERIAALSQRAQGAALQARERVPALETGFQAFQRELGLGGGLLAGGLAYRLFLWLLPLGLLGAQMLSFWLDANEESVEDAAKEFGIGAAAVASAGDAVGTNDTNRILLALLGLWLLAWFSLGAVRALGIAYSLAWGLPRPRMRKPAHAVLIFNGLFVIVAAASAMLAPLRHELGLVGLLGAGAILVVHISVALVAMWLLPHRVERWQELLPGAVLVAVGAQLLNIAVVVYFAPKLGRSSELYGALGSAAVILVWLYILARLIIDAAFLNATVWEQRQATTEKPPSTTTV